MERPGRPKTALNECVKVVVRCRPISEKEKLDTSEEVVKVWSDRGAVQVHNPKGQDKMFTYDAAYGEASQNDVIYDEMIRPLVASVMDGFNGCVFAYGQTGTGKTHTMEGSNDDPGIITRAFGHMWAHINNSSSRDVTYLVSCSYVELYMEDVRDLLAKDGKKLAIKAQQELNGFYIPEMTSVACKSAEEMVAVMKAGRRRRAMGSTDMNEHSSRSHAVFLVTVETADRDTGTIRVGKLNLVDLAGSERQRKTQAAGDRLREAARINQALSSLGNVIAALAESSPHVPYRDSKLTRILQDSLGGNSKTIMIATVGPAARHYDETITTLRYAHRAKAIRNKPVRNEDPKDAKLREYQAEIERLKELIKARQQTKPKPAQPSPAPSYTNKDAGVEEVDPEEFLLEQARAASRLHSERLLASELEAQVRALEERLVQGGGGKELINNLNESQLMLEQKQQEIAERRQREREMQQRIELEEETAASVTTTFTNLRQDTDYKTQRLKKCVCMYLGLREEMVEQREAHDAERRELEAGVGALLGALRRAATLGECLVPRGLGRVPTAPLRRPSSSPSRRRYACSEGGASSRYENVLQLAPVPLPSTTRRYPTHTPQTHVPRAQKEVAPPSRRARASTSHQRLGAGVR